MSYYADTAFFPKEGDKRYHIQIKVMRGDTNCMQPVQCMSSPITILADVGADITLLTNEEAHRLGYNLDLLYDNFPVQGIAGTPTEFKQTDTWIQIGDLQPIFAPVGLCTTQEGLFENLLGNKGLLDSGKIYAIYNDKGVQYKMTAASVAGSF